jgi:hypothetical protein
MLDKVIFFTMEKSDQQDLVELLFLALYEDGHLSVDENVMLQKALTALGWEPHERTGPSVGKAFASVREAISCEVTKDAYLIERAARLKAAGHSSSALQWIGSVLASDGLHSKEERFLEKARQLLFD